MILKRYYNKTQFPTVYGDGMILNPRTKLVIFNEETWDDTASEEYSNACRHRFIQEYDNPPNNPSHQIGNPLYPDLSRMARDVLPVPASGCAVEREFSISGRMAIWQRNRLGARTISESMMYKAALRKTRTPMLSSEIRVTMLIVLLFQKGRGMSPRNGYKIGG